MTAQTMWEENSCRLCCEEKIEMFSIFGEEGLRRRVPQKLRDCLPIMVYKTDPLPKQICQFCAARLDDVFEFREYCLNIYKNMHLKLLAKKHLNSVKIFLDAMLNSPDPCQVQLCMIKQRAPPPLVPLPSSLLEKNSTPLSAVAPKLDCMNFNSELLSELPCEVQIKEEPSELPAKADFILNIDDTNQSLVDERFKEYTVLGDSEMKNYRSESNKIKTESTTDEKKTSILEQVLTGNLTINNCQELIPKTKLSSEWWCSPCNNYYKTKESLIKHMRFYCPQKYSCGKCSLVFDTIEELAKHEANYHLKINLDFDELVKECHQCDREFVSWEMLRHHRLHDHPAEPVEHTTNRRCSLCNRVFSSEESYHNHQQLHEAGSFSNLTNHESNASIENVQENSTEIRREHFIENVKTLTCPTCGKVCTQQSALSNHIRTHEPKKHKCDICGRSFGLFIRLAAHKLNEHNVQPTMSPIVMSVEQEDVLNAEREARSARGEKLSKSEHCRTFSETFDGDGLTSDQPPLKRNAPRKVNALKNVARCGICQEWFGDHTTMLTHLQTHSDNIFSKNFKCSTCKKCFKEKWQLQRHEGTHKFGKTSAYECSVCCKPFSDKAQLDAHEKIHIVDKTYHCPKCNKIFFKELSLMSHQCTSIVASTKRNSASTNTNKKKSTPIADKQFMCPKCPDVFDTTQLRNLHMRIHSEQTLQSSDISKNLNGDDDSIIYFKPEISLSTPMLLLEPKIEITEDQNPLVPQKRTLIRTAGGYRCGVCQSPFVLRELAVAHLRSAHPVMPYQCPYCKKRFTTQYTFTHHIKTHHPNESEK